MKNNINFTSNLRLRFVALATVTLVAQNVFAQTDSAAALGESKTAGDVTVPASKSSVSFSEYFHQPAQGKTRLEVAPTFTSNKEKYKTRSGRSYDDETNTERVAINGSHGLSDSTALEFEVSHEVSELTWTGYSKGKTKSRGLNDLIVGIQSLKKGESSNIVYGASAQLSPGKAQYANTKVDGNNFSGGQTLSPYVGIETVSGRSVYGANLRYDLRTLREAERKMPNGEVYDSISTTGGDGLGLTAFAEYHGQATIGASLRLKSNFEAKVNSSDDGQYTLPQNEMLTARIYSNISAGDGFEVVPSLKYDTLLSKTVGTVSYSQSDSFAISILGRFSL